MKKRITKTYRGLLNSQYFNFFGLFWMVAFAISGVYLLISSQAATVIKPQLGGVIDRQREPSPSGYYPSVINGFVVKNYDAAKSDVTWAELQPSQGGEITVNNTIDTAIANARAKGNVRLKLRVYAGYGAPAWAKNLPVTSGQPGPFEICDNAADGGASNCGTIGHIWEVNYRQAYKDFQTKLAAKYDGIAEVQEVAITGCATTYGEPLLRQGSSNFAAYQAAGYNESANKDCERDQIVAHNAWKATRSGIALNPYQEFDAAAGRFIVNEYFTEEIIDYCRQILGERCVLGNNSVGKKETVYTCADINSAGWGSRDNYARMYTKMKCMGKPIYFQTATATKIAAAGNTLGEVLTWAAEQGAGMVELPAGYDNSTGQNASAVYISSSAMVSYDNALANNALAASSTPPPPTPPPTTPPPPPTPDTTPPVTAISSPTNGSTVSGTINITATATDNVAVTKVELYIGGNKISTDVAAPYVFSWNTNIYTNNNYNIAVMAYDNAGNTKTSTNITLIVDNPVPPGPRSGDANGDGKVDAFDASILLFNFGKSGQTRAQGDLNGDGVVNVFDASILLFNYGKQS